MNEDDFIFDDDDDAIVNQTPVEEQSSNEDDFIFDDDEDDSQEDISSDLSLESQEQDFIFDDDDSQTVGDVSSAVAPVSVEEPEAPEGYKYSMELVTDSEGNTSAQRVLKKVTGRFEGPEYTDPAFTYEDTGEALSRLGSSVYDTLSLVDTKPKNVFGETFTVDYVPEYLRPFVRTVGKAVDGTIVQPVFGTAKDLTNVALGTLDLGLQFGKESIQGIGTAVTRAVHEGITSESDAVDTLTSLPGSNNAAAILSAIQEGAKLLDIEGTDIIKSSPTTAGKQLTRDTVLALETAGIMSSPAIGARIALAPLRAAKKEIADATRSANRRIRVDEAKANETRLIAERRAKAAKDVRERANEADKEARATITEIEEELLDGQSIHRITKSGRIAIDYDKAIDLGRKKTDELISGELADDVVLQDVVGTTNQLLHPILQPDKFEPVLAALMKMKDRYPDAFKPAKHLEGPYKGRKKTFGQQLKDLVIANTDEANQELFDIASRYGLTRDDLANMIMSGDRIAAQTLRAKGIALQKLRRGGKETPATKLDDAQVKHEKDFEEASKNLSTLVQNIKRGENIVLGLLTGTIGTAARNLESFLLRSPLEGLVRLMEEATIQAANKIKARKFVGPPEPPKLSNDELIVLADRNPHATALEGLSNTWDITRGNPKQMQELVDYISSSAGKEYAQLNKRLYSNIEELQMGYGRGEGKFGDATLSAIEDLVQVLNAPNRWQEFHIRNGHYFGSIQQQIQREWGLNFIETMNRRGIKDFLNDSPQLRPKGARSFKDILAKATEDALEITYAAAPKTQTGKAVINWFRKTPFASVLMAFPRFSLKAMEYFGATFAGAPYVMARRALSKGKPSPNDTNLIAMNVAGGVGVASATMYRLSDDAPADYTKIKTPGGNEVDTTYLIPLPQMLWFGELFAQWIKGDGDVSDFLKGGGNKKFVELFTGTNAKANQQLGTVFNNLVDSMSDKDSLRSDQIVSKTVGDFFGSLAGRPFRPLSQVVDAERMLGRRPLEFRSFSADPVIDNMPKAIAKRMGKQLRNQGILRTAEEEKKFPIKSYPFNPEGKTRVLPAARLFLGATITSPPTEIQEWLTRRNYRQQYLFEGRTGIDTVDDVITETFNNIAIPQILEIMKSEKSKMSKAKTREEKKKVYKESRELVDAFLTRVKNVASSTPYKFRKGKVDEKGVRTTGTFNQKYVIELARVMRLNSDDLKRAMDETRVIMDIPKDAPLDFTNTTILRNIANAGEVRKKKIRDIVNKAIPSLN